MTCSADLSYAMPMSMCLPGLLICALWLATALAFHSLSYTRAAALRFFCAHVPAFSINFHYTPFLASTISFFGEVLEVLG